MMMIRNLIIAGLIWAAGLTGLGYAHSPLSDSMRAAASSLAHTAGAVSLSDLRADYGGAKAQERARILIVPGHEPDFGGAQFGSAYERDLVVEIGQDLQQYLQADGNYQPLMTRDAKGWNPVFSNYFADNSADIASWEETSRLNAPAIDSLGMSSQPSVPPVEHNSAPPDVALRLYGVTKWANENGIDLMLHLHLNDYPRRHASKPGKYSGLVIYTPARQYANSTTTKAVADAVFKRLSLYNPISSLPVESSGVIDDPELIAVGANNTSDAASMLIEYDYLYEPQFTNLDVRSLALKDLAYQTYLGLQDFFTSASAVTATSSYNPASLYAWKTPVKGKGSDPRDIYALQTALILDGDYPAVGSTRNECPHSGSFGPCTEAALKAFQKKGGIAGEGPAGAKTWALLSRIYSGN